MHVDSVDIRFDGKKILSDVFLKCETSDIVAIFGRNGSGKSTLLKAIYGTIKPENLFLKINNKVITKTADVRKMVSFLPQNQFLPNNISVRNVINLWFEKNEIHDFCDDELLKPIIDNKIETLSGGELKYLEVKLVLHSRTMFCILDEPYSGISPIMIEKINELILQQSKIKGLIITDHDYQNMLNIATKLYLIKDQHGHFIPNKETLVAKGYLRDYML